MTAETLRKKAILILAAAAATVATGASAAAANPAARAPGPTTRPVVPALASVTAPGPAAQKSAKTPTVAGSARVFYAYAPADDIRFSFDAQGASFSRPRPGLPGGAPLDARGTFRVSHKCIKQNVTVWFEGAVDCLVTGGRTATLTAVVNKTSPNAAELLRTRVGLSVYDGSTKGGDRRGGDRIGFSWGPANIAMAGESNANARIELEKVGTCMAPAPFAPVKHGGYTVRHGDLPPIPGGH